MSKIENIKKAVPNTKDMNDMDILFDVLYSEKEISSNYNLAISEMSNKTLYKKILDLYKEVKNLGREAFEISFKYGWYPLEKAEETKITQAYNEANGQVKELG